MERRTARRVRWAVPVVAAGLVVGGAQLTAWAAGSTSGLPTVSARDLLVKAQQAQVDQLSGTVRSTAKLGLPALPSRGDGVNWSSLVAGTQTLRVFADGPARQRVDLIGDLAQASVVHDSRTLWTWSSTTRAVTKATLPAADTTKQADGSSDGPALTPQEAADRALAAVTPTTDLFVGGESKVAGRPTYDLRLTPKESASLVGSVDLYVDAATGLTLRTVVTPRGSSEPAVDIGFTDLRLQAPPRSTFAFTAPPGAKVRTVTVPAHAPTGNRVDRVRPHGSPSTTTVGSGWTAVLVTTAPSAASVVGGDTTGVGDVLLKSATTVQGAFGTGKLLRTRLVSVLQTDNGRVFVGAVTPAELMRVATSSAQAR